MVITGIEEVNEYLLAVSNSRYRDENHRLLELRPRSLECSTALVYHTMYLISELVNMLIHHRIYGTNDEWIEYMMSIVVITPNNGLITFRKARIAKDTRSNDRISIRRFIKLKSDNVIQSVYTQYLS